MRVVGFITPPAVITQNPRSSPKAREGLSPVVPGVYEFQVGTAGSATLVLQTVLPPLLTAGGPSRVVVEGGTHNPLAPPFDFLERSFLPVLSMMGARVSARLERWGFFPAGGGCVVVEIEPAPGLRPVELVERGKIRQRIARAVVANLPLSIARRELAHVQQALSQLLIPLAMAGGGAFRTGPPSRHTLTNLEVVRRFRQSPGESLFLRA
jgi:RNA 3'-terminal phosphate cyclase